MDESKPPIYSISKRQLLVRSRKSIVAKALGRHVERNLGLILLVAAVAIAIVWVLRIVVTLVANIMLGMIMAGVL